MQSKARRTRHRHSQPETRDERSATNEKDFATADSSNDYLSDDLPPSTNKPSLSCKHCEKRFSSALRLKKHYVRAGHGHSCGPCKKGFLTHRQLKQHSRRHTVNISSHSKTQQPIGSSARPSRIRRYACCGHPVALITCMVLMSMLLYLYHHSRFGPQIQIEGVIEENVHL